MLYTFKTISSITCQSLLPRDKEQCSVLYQLPTKEGKLTVDVQSLGSARLKNASLLHPACFCTQMLNILLGAV